MSMDQVQLDLLKVGPNWTVGAFLDFFTEMVAQFPVSEDITANLSAVLEIVGRYLDARRVTIALENEAVTQELVWTSAHADQEPGEEARVLPLKKSGPRNSITIFMADPGVHPESLYRLIAALIDSNLTAMQLLRAEHSQRKLAESINHISEILTSTLDRDELLSLFVDQLEMLVPFDSASVMLLHDGLLYMHAARGYESFSEPVDISQISFIPDKTFLMEEVLNGREPVVLSDTCESPQWIWSPCGEHIRSWMGVPLIVEGHTIGLFSIDKSIPNFFTPKHAQLASALAKHAALAIDNALLFAKARDANKELQGLSAKVIEAQEKERQRIAMELHDHAGQALLALRAELQVLRHHLANDQKNVQGQINYLDHIVLDLSKELEQLAYDLRPPTLSALGLISALDQYCDDFSRRMGITSQLNYSENFKRLPENIELVSYRIVQEALTNAARHSKADRVEIEVRCEAGLLCLTVTDNGIGFERRSHRKGYGLVGIRERLSQIQGQLEIKSRTDRGTSLIVTIPVPEIEADHDRS